MSWLIGGLLACCTVSLVVGSDGALLNPQNARTSNAPNTNNRFPMFPRRELSFRNDTSVSEKSVYTTRTSAALTDSVLMTQTETGLPPTSTLKEHIFPSKFTSSDPLSDTLLESSSNVPSTSSALNSSGVVSHGTTKVSIAPPIISALATTSTRVWKSEQVYLDISGVASSINPSRTASSLVVTPEPKPSLGNSLVSTLLQDVASSQTAVAQLPIITSALVYSLSDRLITNLLSTTYSEAQQQWNQSTASSAILYPTTTQNAEFLASKSTHVPSSIAVVSSQQKQHVDAPTETSSGFSNLGTALSMLPNASKTANGLQQHLVSSLVNWSPPIFSTAGTSRSNGTEVATVPATTLTKTILQQIALTSGVVENFFTSTTPVPNNTLSPSFLSTVHSGQSVANAPWLSLVFTWTNSQTAILPTLVLPAKSDIPKTSNIYTNTRFSGIVPTTSQTRTPQSITSSTSGPKATPMQGNSFFLPSGIYPTSASGNENVSSWVRSGSSPQMIQTRLYLGSKSASLTPTSLMLTHIQTSAPIRTVEIADAQYVSSGIFSSTTSLPCSSISTPFTGWTNTSAPKPTEESAAFSQPTISTSLKANSSATPLVLWYMSRTSSLSSTSTSPPVSKYMDISSFVTRTRTPSSEPPSQTILVASDVNTTITSSSNTALLPMHSPTETVAATSSPSLTTSEAAGVAIGSTAGLLLAIVAVVFVARRYHAARSAKHRSDGSSGAYPQLAYLYDPSLGRAESDKGGDDEESAFMSGGATGRPLTPTRSRTPPPAPHNSVDFGYGRLYSLDSPYSDPGNPFTNTEDPFLEWRSSDAISTPTDTRFALAAAVVRYSNGPQKPLPPLPNSVSTHAFRDHIIPSPTLSPITNGYGFRRSLVRSSSRSSVQSQRSLRKFHCSSSSNSSSRDHGRGQRHSLMSIHETDSQHRISDLMEHDLLLPVDTQSETSDSVVVYASTLTSQSLTQYSTPAPFESNPVSTSWREDTPHLKPQPNHSTYPSLHSSGPSLINPIPTDISYADFPSPPITTCTPTHKGWDEIKRMSTDYTILLSPLSPLSPSSFSPTFPSPPPPLKKRSLVNSSRKTRLSSTSTTSRPRGLRGHRSVPAPLRIKTKFEESERKGVEAKRRSWLEKVQSMGNLRGER